MNGYAFTFAAQPLVALPSGALHWPDHRLLIVSDLHLGKSERMARRGGTLLPPYETRETLTRLSGDLESTGAKSLISLGDSFDDLTAADTLDEGDSMTLNRLMAGRDWIWVMGNHDAGTFALGGTHRADVTIGPIAFRHIATAQTPEVSGHYHPKARLGPTVRRCFLVDHHRIILPAYGAYTGGLYCDDPALTTLMANTAIAVLTGPKAIPCPMPRVAPKPPGFPFR
jgi:uncharacterized protein